MPTERQEIYCHECNNYVQFDIDVSLNGNHIINCPVCGHEHCRVIEDGKVTDVRWDSRNNFLVNNPTTATYITTNLTNTTASTFDSYTANTNGYNGVTGNSSTNYILYQSWMNTTPTS